jgi:uncharacterized membrane protein YgdD (TMEM256/DUF423 family)
MPDRRDNARGSAPKGALLCILALTGLAGAAGVSLAAVAAHKVQSPALATAATMLMIHAAAALGLVALAVRLPRPALWLALAAVMLAGVALFSGDVSYFTIEGGHIFPHAAPIGGSTLILTWFGVAALALISLRSGAD